MGSFDILLLNIRICIASIGVVVITVAAVRSVFQLIRMVIQENFSPNYVRLQFGNSVILGMEFMVGADLVGHAADLAISIGEVATGFIIASRAADIVFGILDTSDDENPCVVSEGEE